MGLSQDRLVGWGGAEMDVGDVTPGKTLSQGRPNSSGLCEAMVPTADQGHAHAALLGVPYTGAPFPRREALSSRPLEISSWARRQDQPMWSGVWLKLIEGSHSFQGPPD